MNRVEMIGRLVRPVDLRFTQSGTPLTQFTLVVDSTPRWDNELKKSVSSGNFIAVQMWGNAAERLAEADPPKGSTLYVLGELTQSQWERHDGTKESKTRVKAHYVRWLDEPAGVKAEPKPDFGEDAPF